MITGLGFAQQGVASKGQYSVRSYYGSEQQEDQMTELEAELEAELDQLTGGDSATMDSQYSAMDEVLTGVFEFRIASLQG